MLQRDRFYTLAVLIGLNTGAYWVLEFIKTLR